MVHPCRLSELSDLTLAQPSYAIAPFLSSSATCPGRWRYFRRTLWRHFRRTGVPPRPNQTALRSVLPWSEWPARVRFRPTPRSTREGEGHGDQRRPGKLSDPHGRGVRGGGRRHVPRPPRERRSADRSPPLGPGAGGPHEGDGPADPLRRPRRPLRDAAEAQRVGRDPRSLRARGAHADPERHAPARHARLRGAAGVAGQRSAGRVVASFADPDAWPASGGGE